VEPGAKKVGIAPEEEAPAASAVPKIDRPNDAALVRKVTEAKEKKGLRPEP